MPLKCSHCGGTGQEPQNGHTLVSPEGFETFWTDYPRHVAKQAAIRAWRRQHLTLRDRAEIALRLADLKHSADWRKQGGAFIPYPATWLNGRRWEDEAQESAEAEWEGIDCGR